jgi:Na+/H+ antiporter NhaD/arsenite permease-like protein
MCTVCDSTGLFEIVGILTTCHTQYTSDSSICIFYLIEQHSHFLLHTLQVPYMCTVCDSTGLFEIVGILTTWHTE